MDPQWLTGIGTLILAAATFTLALFAFLGMRSSRKQTELVVEENRRIRGEERQFRFQIDVLNEVRNWAAEAIKLGFQYNRGMDAADSFLAENLLDDIAKNTDFPDLAIRLFQEELKVAILAVMNVLSTNRQRTNHPEDKGNIGDNYYFDCLFELMQAIRNVKLRLYNIY